MAIIRLMLPLFCQLISISPRVTGDNRLLHHPPAAPRRGSLPWHPAPASPPRGVPRARPAQGMEYGTGSTPAPLPQEGGSARKGAHLESLLQWYHQHGLPWARVPAQRKNILQHPRVMSLIAAP